MENIKKTPPKARKKPVSADQYIADAIASLKGEADVLVFGIDEASQKQQDSNAGRVFFIEENAKLVRISQLLNVQQVAHSNDYISPKELKLKFKALLSLLFPSFSLVVLNKEPQHIRTTYYAFAAASQNECKLILNGNVLSENGKLVADIAAINGYELTETINELTVWMPKQN